MSRRKCFDLALEAVAGSDATATRIRVNGREVVGAITVATFGHAYRLEGVSWRNEGGEPLAVVAGPASTMTELDEAVLAGCSRMDLHVVWLDGEVVRVAVLVNWWADPDEPRSPITRAGTFRFLRTPEARAS